MSLTLNTNNHPCFNEQVKGTCGRVHLPVAPKCNIKCNYCNRKYDCVNESRPGVSSAIVTPEGAVTYLEEVLQRTPEITVAGIAGPGDAFAEPEKTLKTLRLVRERFPHIILCLATNGLNLEPYVDDLARLQVSHVTITVNAVDPEIGAQIYSWVRDGKVIHRKRQAAEVILRRQLSAIRALKQNGIIVKVNTIVVPGVNDHHVIEVARKMAELGVDIQNCMAMYSNKETPFENIPEPSPETMAAVQEEAGKLIPQMKHCTRCRADAVGLLSDDKSDLFHGCLAECSRPRVQDTAEKPYVAVATLEGILVNQHLGEAARLQIWSRSESGFHVVAERRTPRPGTGHRRWLELAEVLKDCRAVLISGIGETPAQFLSDAGITPVVMSGFIQDGLQAAYNGGDVNALKPRRKALAKGGCSMSGGGCG